MLAYCQKKANVTLQGHQNIQVLHFSNLLGIGKKIHALFPRIYFNIIVGMDHLDKYIDLFVCSVYIKVYALFNMPL